MNKTKLININCDGTIQFNVKLDEGEAHYIQEAVKTGRRIIFTFVKGEKTTRLGSVRSKVRQE